MFPTSSLPCAVLLFLLPSAITVAASPSPAYLVGDDFTHLVPRGALFFRQADNLQSFTGKLGGFGASAITKSGDGKRVFSVDGDTFPDFDSAGQRSCDNQFQKCSEAANKNKNAGFSVGDCDGQKGMFFDHLDLYFVFVFVFRVAEGWGGRCSSGGLSRCMVAWGCWRRDD